jgi:hypothetical protein
MIIYFLHMLYFERMQEEHFGSIRQQIWSFLRFPLPTVLVLVLQGVSRLTIWRQAVESLSTLYSYSKPASLWVQTGDDFDPTTEFGKTMLQVGGNFTNSTTFTSYFNRTCYESVYNHIPKGVDASREIKTVSSAFYDIKMGLDKYLVNQVAIRRTIRYPPASTRWVQRRTRRCWTHLVSRLQRARIRKPGSPRRFRIRE